MLSYLLHLLLYLALLIIIYYHLSLSLHSIHHYRPNNSISSLNIHQ